MTETRHFLDLADIPSEALRSILSNSAEMKRANGAAGKAKGDKPLAGKTLAMIFDKPSTRTRVSFEVAMRQLGGDVIVMDSANMQLGRGETIADTARVLSRYVDVLMIRTGEHAKVLELAEYATIPVLNGLTDHSHPCQVMADILTFEELRGPIRDRKLAWSGDCNNVLTSLVHAAAKFDFRLDAAAPKSLQPPPELVAWAKANKVRLQVTDNPEEAVVDADAVITDTWVSMHDTDVGRRHNLLAPYRVTSDLMRRAKSDAIFMHCLPAHRGDEVEADVIDGPQSAVFDEAENRLHVQKGILAWCLT